MRPGGRRYGVVGVGALPDEAWLELVWSST